MHRHTTRLLTTLAAAALLLTAIATNAPARNLQATEQSVRVSWASLEIATSFTTIRCRVTLEGSFHNRTIAKVARSLVGAITRAIVGHPCTNGEAWADNGSESEPLGTAPNKLPFHLTYEGFEGALPNITSLNGAVSRFSFVLRSTVLGLTCQGRYGRLEDNISAIGTREGGGGITRLEPREGSNIAHLVEQLGPNAVCPATGTFRGASGPVTNLTDGRTITITLI